MTSHALQLVVVLIAFVGLLAAGRYWLSRGSGHSRFCKCERCRIRESERYIESELRDLAARDMLR